MPVIPDQNNRQRTADKKFKVALRYLGSSKPTWVLRDSISVKEVVVVRWLSQ